MRKVPIHNLSPPLRDPQGSYSSEIKKKISGDQLDLYTTAMLTRSTFKQSKHLFFIKLDENKETLNRKNSKKKKQKKKIVKKELSPLRTYQNPEMPTESSQGQEKKHINRIYIESSLQKTLKLFPSLPLQFRIGGNDRYEKNEGIRGQNKFKTVGKEQKLFDSKTNIGKNMWKKVKIESKSLENKKKKFDYPRIQRLEVYSPWSTEKQEHPLQL